ncbi:MAG: hypothetical protein AAB470_02840 [Patescibacteria group bacterium]
MRPKYFFECCRDLVALRWRSLINHHGQIFLIPKNHLVCDGPEFSLHPIVAVAYEVTGFNRFEEDDILNVASQRIDLPSEFAKILAIAAIRRDERNQRLMSVRTDLVGCLHPQKMYEPPLNSLRPSLIQ